MSKPFFPYAQFCDQNNIRRLDITAEQHLANLDLAAVALLECRGRFLVEIAQRCPTCAGTGKREGAN